MPENVLRPSFPELAAAPLSRSSCNASDLVFNHIPKVAGASFIEDLKQNGYHLTTNDKDEPCWRDIACPGALHTSLLRSPRSHVYSMYLFCRFSGWFRHETKGTAFPRGGTVEVDFEAWLDHFLDTPSAELLGDEGAFNCYNPWNVQARAFTCEALPPNENGWGGTLHRPKAAELLVPELSAAVDSLSRVQLVGPTELYNETWCLLELRAQGTLPPSCECGSAAPPSFHLSHDDHDDQESRPNGTTVPSLGSLPERALRKIDALTAVDRQLYEVAIDRFAAAVDEAEKRTGKEIVCKKRWAAVGRLEGGPSSAT